MARAPLRTALAAAALLALAAAGGAARAEDAPPGARQDRPLGVITPGPWRGLFLDLPLADARPGGEPALTVRWWMANAWSIPTTLTARGRSVVVQQDEQADALEVTARLEWARLLGDGPVARRLATTLAWRATQHWGGWSDGLIDAWHRLGHYNTFDRGAYPSDAVRLTLREPGGATAVALRGPRLAAGDAVLRTSARLLGGEAPLGPWALAARLDLKAPTGRLADAGGSGGWDVGLGLSASGPLTGWLTGHGQVTLARVSPLAAAVPLQPEPWQWGLEAALAARLPGGWTLHAETRALSNLFPSRWVITGQVPRQGDALTAITRWQNQLSFGVRKGPVTAWLCEDFTPGRRIETGWTWFYDTNAPDLVLGVAVAFP